MVGIEIAEHIVKLPELSDTVKGIMLMSSLDAILMGVSSGIALRYVFNDAVNKSEMTVEQAKKYWTVFVGASTLVGIGIGVATVLMNPK